MGPDLETAPPNDLPAPRDPARERAGRVLVTGASGLVGRALVAELVRRGAFVRAQVHRGELPSRAGVEVVRADLRDAGAVEGLVAGVDRIVHLAAAKSDEPESAAVNVTGTTHLVRAAERLGVRRLVHVSTQSVRLRRRGCYGETKLQAEAVVRGAAVPHVILRPSVVYRDFESGVLGSIARFSSWPVVPVFGGGNVVFQPIHVDDLAAVVADSLVEEAAVGVTVDVGGPEKWTFWEMLEGVCRVLGRRRTRITIPISLALLLARVLALLPRPPITRSNVLGAAESVPMDVAPLRGWCRRPLRGLRTGLQDAASLAHLQCRRREASALLAYAHPDRRRLRWTPEEELVERFLHTCARLEIPVRHRLHESFIRRRGQLGALDILTRVLWPDCLLQRKLRIAAALVECHPASAATLLPRARSRARLVAACAGIALRSAGHGLRALLLLPRTRHVRRNAGCL